MKKLLLSLLACMMFVSCLTLQVAAEDLIFDAYITQEYATINETLDITLENASGNTTYQWYVDGIKKGTNATLLVDESMKNAIIEVDVTNNGTTIHDRLMVSNLPVIFIDTENNQAITSKEDYINADMKIQANERYADLLSDPKKSYDGVTEIRGRGNSTWGLPKKPYKLKLDKKTDLFGMGKNKHWVLLASYYDESFMRNTISYGLSGKLGMPFCDSVWVEVVLNGKKVGNYMLCEQIRVGDTRVDIYDWESACEDAAAAIAEANSFSDVDASNLEDIMVEDYSWIDSDSVTYNNTTYKVSDYFEYPNATGGYLFEMDSYYDEISKFKTDSNQPIMFKYPEFANTSDGLFEYAKEYVQAMENAFTSYNYNTTYNGVWIHYTDLVDLQSLLDFWIVNELFFNEDFMKKSTYFYKDIDGKAYMGPIWDMDWAASGAGQTSYYDKWQTLYFSAEAQASQWYKSLVNDPFFLLKVRERYLEIEDLIDEYIVDGGWIDQEAAYLADSGALNDSIWYGGKGTFNDDVNKLKTWLTNRKNWLDTQFASKDSILGSFNIEEGTLSNIIISVDGSELVFDENDSTTFKKSTSIRLQASGITNGKHEYYVNGKLVGTDNVTTGVLDRTISHKSLETEGLNVCTIKNTITDESRTFTFVLESSLTKQGLQALIDKAKSLDTSKMSEDDATVLANAISSASIVVLNENATEYELNDAYKTLENALLAYPNDFKAYISQDYATIGESLSITLEEELGTTTYKWYVEGVEKSTASTLKVDETMMNKIITVEVTNNGKTVSDKMMVSNLPVIFIDTENNQAITSKEDYINADMKIQANERYAEVLSDPKKSYDGVTEIRGRGNSTWGLPKKPYKLKLDKKTDLFGMGKNKHWVLLASYNDPSFMRNTISYGLSDKLGMPFCDSVWVEVVLNGKKIGNYMLCEQIRVDETRIDVYDWESACEDAAAAIAEANNFSDDDASNLEDIMVEDYSWIDSDSVTYNNTTYKVSDYFEYPNATGGYIFEMDEYYDEISKFKTDLNQPIMFKNPEFANTSDELYGYAKEYVQAMEDAFTDEDYNITYKNEEVHYSDLVDMQSLLDFWIVNELFFNEDFMKKSTYFYKDVDEKAYMGPIWDMDYAASGAGSTASYNQWQTEYFSMNAQKDQWYKSLINDPYFLLKVRERYLEIEDLIDAYIVDGGWIDQEAQYLSDSGALNDSIWYSGNSKFNNDVTKLKTWLTNRKNWLDAQFKTKSSLFTSLSQYESEEMNVEILANTTKVRFDQSDNGEVLANQTITINVNGDSNTYSLYVNGKKVETQSANQGSASFVLTYSQVMQNEDKINIITVRDDTKAAKSYGLEKAGTVDTSELEALIARAKLIDSSSYSEESYLALILAVNKAESLLASNNYLKVDISDAIIEIETAIDNLSAGELNEANLINKDEFSDVSVIDLSSECYLGGVPNEDGVATNTLDYDEKTYWHSDYKNDRGMPQYITYDLGNTYYLTDITFLPRQYGTNGDIFEMEIYTKQNESDQFVLAGTYEFDNDGKVLIDREEFKRMEISAVQTRYVKVNITSSGGEGGNVFASMGEIRFYGILSANVVDKSALISKIEEANAIDKTNYSEASVLVLNNAISEATLIKNKLNASEEEVSDAITLIENAIKQLEIKVNKNELQALYDQYVNIDEKDYTASTYLLFKAALDEAKVVLDNNNATQSEVNKAKDNLQNAIDNLQENKVEDVNKAPLLDLYEANKNRVASDYTSETWAIFKQALDDALAIIDTKDATQTQVDEAKLALEEAIANLKDKPTQPTEPDKPVMDFYDVQDKKAWFYGSVESAFTKGLMQATGKAPVNGKPFFEPDTPISRGMVATVLYRMAGLPKVEFKATFSDVTNPKLWYSTAITWASQAGVVSGYKDGSFGPDDNITRQDLAIMLRNFAKANGLDTNAKVDFSAFKDGNKVVSYAQSAVQFCIDAKLMSGAKKADGVYLNPTDKATRAECAKMFSLLDDAIKNK